MNKKVNKKAAVKYIALLICALMATVGIAAYRISSAAARVDGRQRNLALEKSLRSVSRTASGERLGFDGEGNFVMTTHDKIATSSVTYRTLGWTIKRYPAPIAGNDSIRIKLVASGEPVIDPENPAYEYNYFKCTKEIIFEKIEQCSEDWLEELYTKGGTVYLDAIMTVCNSGRPLGSMTAAGVVNGEVYFDFAGISGARPWADKEALRSHFNKAVVFPPNKKMLYGTFEVHYMELIGGTAISLAYLDYDIERTALADIEKVFRARDLSGENLEYRQTKVVSRMYRQEAQTTYPKNPYTLDNRKLRYKYAKIYFYYERDEEDVEKEILSYGSTYVKQNAHTKVSAETKDAPKFDVAKGIPTSEQLRIDGRAQKFCFVMVYQHHSGTKLVPVSVHVSYTVHTETKEGSVDTPVSYTQTCYVARSFSYYTIDRLSLLLADEAIVKNKSFPYDGQQVITGFYCPNVRLEQEKNEYVRLPHASASVSYGTVSEGFSAGSASLQSAAEGACGEIKVYNDTFCVDGLEIMQGGPFETEGRKPKQLSGERPVTFEKGGITIPTLKENGTYKTNAYVRYRLYGSARKNTYACDDTNPVIVHTPVVCHGSSSDGRAYNQQITPTKNNSLILGREFFVSVRTDGQHQDYPGYGERDYGKYTADVQVRFPFPVYRAGTYISENQWVSLSDGTGRFYLPVGVDEGDYDIWYRTLAENYRSVPGGAMCTEQNANLSLENYAAVDQVAVTVLGRMYGLELTDIVDRPRWTHVFYEADGVTKTGRTYRIGERNCNGVPLGIDARFLFPVLRGSHPYNYLAGPIRLGYRVKFRLKTIGDMRGALDGIVMQPVYYHVDESGGSRRQVDLYTAGHLQKISQTLVLGRENRSYRSVTYQNVASPERQQTSVQVWDGEYQLSPDIFVVPHGTDVNAYAAAKGGRLRRDDSLFLTGGCIIVWFRVCSVSGGNWHLDYINQANQGNGYCNMWKTEGFSYTRVDNRGATWRFLDGDMLVFDWDKTLYDDYRTVGTH